MASDLHIKKAVRVVEAGGVIAYPTEAVWGLGCDPDNREACLTLLQIKQRPVEKGMILVAASVAQFAALLSPLPVAQQKQLQQAWANQAKTGPVTFLVPDLEDQVPWWVKGSHESVALRVSLHSQVQQLCQALAAPLVSTSANITGTSPATNRLRVEKTLGSQLDFILPGSLGGATKPSQIIDINTGRVIRAG
ncbi:L-threonylcarbamoyladenylate synthase [Pseudohongiella acticola]|jgi:L-threonylcarbamoyladenylate synthase|uniref:L-threonylcarbamoyladenylate synthase n=1 Tax=Pseudohongiella acticola TaxID=1524254 RepID=UPI0030EC9607